MFERDLQRTCALRLKIFSYQLQFAATLVDRNPSPSEDLHAVVWTKSQQACLGAKHHYTKLSLAIFEREVEVSGFRWAVVRDLASNPDVGVLALDRNSYHSNQIANAKDASLWLEGEAELFKRRHGRNLISLRRHCRTEKTKSERNYKRT